MTSSASATRAASRSRCAPGCRSRGWTEHPVPSGLRLLDLTLPSPAENLALDEALLAAAEERLGRGEPAASCEVLRLWESPVPFVVLGVACRLADDVDEEACARRGVPIL